MKVKTRRVLFAFLLVLVLVAVAAAMMVIGRGHTVYFDNKTLEDYQGQTYKAAVRTDEFECRFEANANTDIDGLIDLSQGYTQKIFSIKTGEEIHDPELAEDFEAIVLDHIKENIKY